jgi:hypothetical protein
MRREPKTAKALSKAVVAKRSVVAPRGSQHLAQSLVYAPGAPRSFLGTLPAENVENHYQDEQRGGASVSGFLQQALWLRAFRHE